MKKLQQYWCIIVVVIGILLLSFGLPKKMIHISKNDSPKHTTTFPDNILTAGTFSKHSAEVIEPTIEPHPITEENIFTFLQGPVSWKKKETWSGRWGNLTVDGNRFGAFGCGFCCMANIYCTLTNYKASPLDVYRYAKESTRYSPQVGFAAIDWKYIKQTLNYMGMQIDLKRKPSDFDTFTEDIKNTKAVIALISSYENSSFWENTPGHYVTLWLYDEEDDTIMIGDSGDPNRNRQQIPLKTVYKSLKTASKYQYLTVTNYQEENNLWKWNKITEKWIAAN